MRMNVHVFSDSPLCVGVSNPDPSNNWVTQLEDVWNERGFAETLKFGSPRSAIYLAHTPGASTLNIKKQIRKKSARAKS